MNNKQTAIYTAVMEQFSKCIHACLSQIHTNLNESSKSPKWIEYNKDNVERYKSDDNLLAHARTNKNTFGWMVVCGDELVGYCGCEGENIIALEVTPKYRKRKYATKFINKAKEQGCGYLRVEKNNRAAISLYFKNGFYIYGSNKKQLFMRLRSLKDKK